MITIDEIDSITGNAVLGTGGEKIGKVGEVYLDDTTGRPEWVTVNTGLFGSSHSFVPLSTASVVGHDLQVGYDKNMVKDAPRVGDDGHLSPAEEDDLYRYYGMSDSGTTSGSDYSTTTGVSGNDLNTTGARFDGGNTGRRDRSGEAGVVGRDTSGPTTDDAMTRSEEELTVGTRTREAGRARLRKFVVTERQSVSVPVSHEEVTLTREPITEGTYDAAMGGAALSEEEHEVVLHEEVPVVSKEVHAVERVRLGTQTVTEQQTVSDEVRKEQIEMETVDTDGDTLKNTKGRKH